MAELSNSEIRDILLSYGHDCGPITPQTKSIYLKKAKTLQNSLNRFPIKSIRKSEPINLYNGTKTKFDKVEDSFVNIIKEKPRTVSPITYGSRKSLEPIVATETNGSNVAAKWYKGSLHALSSCLGNKDKGLLDISDGDMTDSESPLFTKLKKNYFKRAAKSPEFARMQKSSEKSVDKSPWAVPFTDYSSNLPNIILASFIIIIIAVFGTYLTFKTRYSHNELDLAMERLLCPLDDGDHSDCFTDNEFKSLKSYLQRLYGVLTKYSGNCLCDNNNNNNNEGAENCAKLSFQSARDRLNLDLKLDKFAPISNDDWSRLMKLVISLPHEKLNIVGLDINHDRLDQQSLSEDVTYLECLAPRRSLLCRFKLAMILILNWLSYILLSVLIMAVLFLIIYGLYLYRKKQKGAKERRIGELKDIMSNICEILQDQLRRSEINTNIDAFLSLDKIRIMLQQQYPRLRDNVLWEQVKEYTFSNEPCVQMRDTIQHGTTLQWRGRPGWQGSAVHSGKEVSFNRGPTECLKVRNLTLNSYDGNWEEYLRRELNARLQEVGQVLHMGFSKKGSQIIGYLLCVSKEVAGRAFNKMNANYFNGNLLNVKFIRLDKYFERFPEAKQCI